jgi:hypothetical protein
MNRRLLLASLVPLIALAGCAASRGPAARDARPARISHIVFVKLKDPADAPTLIADSNGILPRIPGVARYACGQHLDTGRANVIHDYDVGLYVGFDTSDAYAAYVQNPDHVAFVKSWAPKAEWLHIYDFADETP